MKKLTIIFILFGIVHLNYGQLDITKRNITATQDVNVGDSLISDKISATGNIISDDTVSSNELMVRDTNIIELIETHGAAASFTASNGLTKVAADIRLGGTLSSNTTIAGGGNTFTINGTTNTTYQVGSYFTEMTSTYYRIVNGGNIMKFEASADAPINTALTEVTGVIRLFDFGSLPTGTLGGGEIVNNGDSPYWYNGTSWINLLHDSAWIAIEVDSIRGLTSDTVYYNETSEFKAGINGTTSTETFSVTKTIDFKHQHDIEYTLTNNTTLTIGKMPEGTNPKLSIAQDATGGRTTTIPATSSEGIPVKAGSGTNSLRTGAYKIDLMQFEEVFDTIFYFVTPIN